MKHNFLTFVKENAMWYTYNYYNKLVHQFTFKTAKQIVDVVSTSYRVNKLRLRYYCLTLKIRALYIYRTFISIT